ncbi:hypothetical protein IHE31_05190 [Mycetohabitans rhizoxinica]|uniref:Hydrolase (HAD superfamily) n=1 Tax=Mycetohabitans rhizoxinica TaxID=412963 RepID=A0ABZ2Q2T6_9BURK
MTAPCPTPPLPDIQLGEIAFIDDNQYNAQAADAIGWRGAHHMDAASTRQRLRQLGNWGCRSEPHKRPAI